MRLTIQTFRLLAVLLVSAFYVHAQSAPLLAVDAAADRHPIRAEIYGIANGIDSTFAKEIRLPNFRWGGDATTRYNWQVDSSNAGFDWYFMGGNGQTTPVPGASVDQLITTYGRDGARGLITVPIIPFVNKSSSWSCSFPVSVYGNQQSTNPYVFPDGNTCGNSISTNGTQLLDTNIYANHIDNTTSLQRDGSNTWSAPMAPPPKEECLSISSIMNLEAGPTLIATSSPCNLCIRSSYNWDNNMPLPSRKWTDPQRCSGLLILPTVVGLERPASKAAC